MDQFVTVFREGLSGMGDVRGWWNGEVDQGSPYTLYFATIEVKDPKAIDAVLSPIRGFLAEAKRRMGQAEMYLEWTWTNWERI